VLFLVFSKEPRPHGPWHTPERHGGCLSHWVGTHMSGVAIIHPIMFVRGYAMYIEVETGRRLREILQGNPMWPDETYHIYVLEENGPVINEPIAPGKQRFMILARPAKPLPPDLDYALTDRMLAQMAKEHGALVHRLVEDIAGYAILIDVESNDQIRTLLEPLPITTYVNYEILPLGTMGGHDQHIRALGLDVPFGNNPPTDA
jgi:muconolactone delta-isomerase